MGFLVAFAAVLFAFGTAARTRRPFRGRRVLAVLLTAVAALGAFAAVGSFWAAAQGDVGDMDPPLVVVLGFVYLAVAAGAGMSAWRLAFDHAR